jgi:predicted DNA-binding ribbon-helix-helix protein
MGQLKHIKKSAVIKRSIMINGHKTSVSLENEFWHGLHEVAHGKHTTGTYAGGTDRPQQR